MMSPTIPPAGLLNGRVDQIGVIGPDLEVAMDAYVANLSARLQVFEVDRSTGTFSGTSAKFRIRIAVALTGVLSVELIQSVSGVTLYSKHLESRGPHPSHGLLRR